MSRSRKLTAALNILLSLLFIGIALCVFFFADPPSRDARHDLLLYASLTGAYGVWRLIRVLLAGKKAEENV